MTKEMLPPQPWHPMHDAIDLKHTFKINEELGELVQALGGAIQAISRAGCQGIDAERPDVWPYETNRMWIQKEIADVYANLELVVRRFKLDRQFISDRMEIKMRNLSAWHELA